MVSSHQIKDQVIIFFVIIILEIFEKQESTIKILLLYMKKIWFRPTVAKTQPGK
jgi:hypothetical protein